MLQAGAKYQGTEAGRANHALRQQRYLERRAEKMTHQSSASGPGPLSPASEPLPVVATAPVERGDDDAASSDQAEEGRKRAEPGSDLESRGLRFAGVKGEARRGVRCCCVCGLPVGLAPRAPPGGALKWSFAG